MDAEIVQLAGPYLTAAAGAYGAAVLTRVEDVAADATVSVGRRILQTVWRRRNEAGRQRWRRRSLMSVMPRRTATRRQLCGRRSSALYVTIRNCGRS